MTKRVSFIHHRGAEILFIDWSNSTAPEVLEAMKEAKRIMAERPQGSVRTLTYVLNSRVDRTVTDALKEYVAHNKPFVLAGAVVGLNDLKMVIFNFVNRVTGRNLRAMETIEEAKDWLAAAKP
ncbi:MAG TPA: hypothetical protein VF618_19875 [Thermoanaerobaculia bacterium]